MFPGSKYILLRDYNFESKMSNRGIHELTAFAKDSNIEVCDDPGYIYTYHHATLDQKSLIDHVFVHYDLIDLIAMLYMMVLTYQIIHLFSFVCRIV